MDYLKTRINDKPDADVDPLNVEGLAMKDAIEAQGRDLPAGNIAAFVSERDDAGPNSELRRFVENGRLVRPSLAVLRVTVETGSRTLLCAASEAAPISRAFWKAATAGALVDVDGSEIGSVSILARELSWRCNYPVEPTLS